MAEASPADAAAAAAFVAALEKSPSRVTRAIATIKPGTAAQTTALAALKAAGATNVQTLAGQPMLVIEGNANHFRALLSSGQVVRFQQDSAAPTN